MSGVPVGLNYQVLFMRMDHLRLDDKQWELMFSDIRHMEFAALSVLSQNDAD